MSTYKNKPKRLLTQISMEREALPLTVSYCAGFEIEVWRCDALADHLIEWMADYALHEDELAGHHGNMYVRLREAAARVYTSGKHERRGEVGEIALHAVCRDFFDTIPIAPRVFYLTSSNDVVKSFDLVHVRYPSSSPELWLGEAKFYEDGASAISAAIDSVRTHIDQGFLNNEKLLLGPQVSKSVPHFLEIRELLSTQSSLDELFKSAVFPIFIACNSSAAAAAKRFCDEYTIEIKSEVAKLSKAIIESGLLAKIRIVLIYLPLASKKLLADAFDKRLKGLQP